MNSAEEIVKFWLQEKGYFIQSSIRLSRNKEIDILAINVNNQKKIHLEVSVSMRMADYTNTPQAKAQEYYDKKFTHTIVKNEIERIFSKKTYKKQLVVGDITLQHKNQLVEFTKECKKLGIKVIHIPTILDEVIPKLGTGSQLNPIIKTAQIISKFYNNENTKI